MALDGISGAILDVAWVPGSAAMFAVVVAAHVAVFDLSVSAVAPRDDGVPPPHPDRPLETRASIVAAAFARRKGTIALLLLSEDGLGYCHVFPESGVARETDVVVSPESAIAFPEAVAGRAGLSYRTPRRTTSRSPPSTAAPPSPRASTSPRPPRRRASCRRASCARARTRRR